MKYTTLLFLALTVAVYAQDFGFFYGTPNDTAGDSNVLVGVNSVTLSNRVAEVAIKANAAVLAKLATHTNRVDNPHGVTAEQIGALTGETDSAALAALSTKEASIMMAIQTNRVTELYDAAADLYWRSVGGTNLTSYRLVPGTTNYTITVLSGNFIYQALDVGMSLTNQFPFAARIEDNPGLEGRWESGNIAYVYSEADWQAPAWRSSYPGFPQILTPYNQWASGSARVDRVIAFVTNLVGSYNLPTGEVWKAIQSLGEGVTPSPYTPFSSIIHPANGTATVAFAHGIQPLIICTNDTVVTIDGSGYETNGICRVSLTVRSWTNIVSWTTAAVDYASTPVMSTNADTSILIRRVANGRWKGAQLQ